MVVSAVVGAKCVLQDIWKADVAARLIQDEGVTYTMASTPFLSDLTDEAVQGRWDFGRFRVSLSAGAPIPTSLVKAARQRWGAHVLPGWGTNENGWVTSTLTTDPEEKGVYTDGFAFESMELRVVDGRKRGLPPERARALGGRG